MVAADIQDHEVDELRQYAQDVSCVFSEVFESAGDRFCGGKTLLDRFNNAINNVIQNGRSFFQGVDENHNELCVAKTLIEMANPQFLVVKYEPEISGCSKSIDFCAETSSTAIWVDVKTIKPQRKDKWEQFQKMKENARFPANVDLCLCKECLGGELWHDEFTVRSRMLEYSIEMEDKINQGNLCNGKDKFVMLFCGEGFYWHQDRLEDFVAFYRSGIHRDDDPFSKMESYSVQNEELCIRKTISSFACLSRQQFDVDLRRINWNVTLTKRPYYSLSFLVTQ